VSRTGNEVGLTEADLDALDPDDRTRRIARASQKLQAAGAHYVIECAADLPPVIEQIEARLARSERP
jgi:phosphonoacetaldehyde hydrolase